MSSLASTAMRICAYQLLRGKTLAGNRVHDSAITPIDDLVSEDGLEPFIVVSSEDEEAAITARDVLVGERTVDLVIEIAISQEISAPPNTPDGEPPAPEVVIPATDGGLELSLSLLSRQVMRALFESNNDPWCDAFRDFALTVSKITNRRGVGNKDGARFAARQIILTIEPMGEPAFGLTPTADDPWGRFLALISQNAELAPIEPLIRSVITGKPAIGDWERGRAALGLTDAAAAAIGIGPAGSLVGEEPAVVSGGTLEETTGE